LIDASFAIALVAKLMLATPGADAWKKAEIGGIRGITIGPIENGYHPGVGYGSPAYGRTLGEVRAMGATWVAITPFGRVADLTGTGVDLTFEAPFAQNRADVTRAIELAHARGLHVMLVPHLWVETGEWRGYLAPGTDDAWARWAESYGAFLRTWAGVAEATHVEMFSVGVELRSWVTTTRAPSFAAIIKDVRKTYRGLLTYSSNWDDVEDAVILGAIDVIGINAFYPLATHEGASDEELLEGARAVRTKVHSLAERWGKPVVFTELGYTTRPDPAVRPWEWPEALGRVVVDEVAQAQAYRALLAPVLDEPDFAGFFVWRLYADPDDVSQEAPMAFSPRGKRAEVVMRDAFAARWAADPWWRGWGKAAGAPGVFP
jgi:sugar phosphate isomerase/epimerase